VRVESMPCPPPPDPSSGSTEEARSSIDPRSVVADGNRLLGLIRSSRCTVVSTVAIDLGTTTVRTRARRLLTGRSVEIVAIENPQRFGGSDVMNRISYDTSGPVSYARRCARQSTESCARSTNASDLEARGLRVVVVATRRCATSSRSRRCADRSAALQVVDGDRACAHGQRESTELLNSPGRSAQSPPEGARLGCSTHCEPRWIRCRR